MQLHIHTKFQNSSETVCIQKVINGRTVLAEPIGAHLTSDLFFFREKLHETDESIHTGA